MNRTKAIRLIAEAKDQAEQRLSKEIDALGDRSAWGWMPRIERIYLTADSIAHARGVYDGIAVVLAGIEGRLSECHVGNPGFIVASPALANSSAVAEWREPTTTTRGTSRGTPRQRPCSALSLATLTMTWISDR